MLCANYTVMGFATNVVLIVSRSIACEIGNEFVTFKFKRQPTISWFILQFNFNKLEVSHSWAFILAMKPHGETTYLGQCNHLLEVVWGNVIFGQMSIVSQLKHLTLDRS
jgi:hypothetical protein